MPFSVRLVPCCLALLLAAVPSLGYPSGAPETVCSNDLTPGHGEEGNKANAYQLSVQPKEDGSFVVQILANEEPYFKGFVVQARDKKGKPYKGGEWRSEDGNGKAISKCNAITHSSDSSKNKLKLRWTPTRFITEKEVTFVATILKEYNLWYKNIVGRSKRPESPPRKGFRTTTPSHEENPEEHFQFDLHDPEPRFPPPEDEAHTRHHPEEEAHQRPVPHWALRSQGRPHWDGASESPARPWEGSESHSEPAQPWNGAAEPHWQSEEAVDEPAVFQSHLPPAAPPIRKGARPTVVKTARRPISSPAHSGASEEPFTRHSQAFWAPVSHQHHIEHVQPQHMLRSSRFRQGSQFSQPQQIHQASQTQEDELDAFFQQPLQQAFVPQPTKQPVRSQFRGQPRQRFRPAVRAPQRFRPQRIQQQQQQQQHPQDEEEIIEFSHQRTPTTRMFQTPARLSFRRPVAFQIRHF